MARGSVARHSRAARPLPTLATLFEYIEPRRLFSVGGFSGAGLVGQYFPNTTLSGNPAFTRTDVRIDADWNGLSPAGSNSAGFANFPGTNWSAKWTGNIIPAYSEAYTFTTLSDDGIRVIVNGQTVINDWTDHAATTDNGAINLIAGQAYTIEVDYYQKSGGSLAHLLWSSASTPQQVIEPATPIGINAGTAADYDNSLPFADAVKMSRGWTSIFTPWGDNLTTTDANGWPTTDAALPLFDATDRAGAYALTFNGSATLGFKGTYSGVTLSNQKYDPATNTTTATITIDNDGTVGIGQSALALIFTNTQRTSNSPLDTGVANVTLMRPTADGAATSIPAGTLYTPYYQSLISDFSTIRFMDYLDTNGSTIATWTDRTLPGDITQNQTNGGSLEYAVELANETGKDLYINVPFYANDDYVTKLAELIKYGSDGINPYTSAQSDPLYPPLNTGLKLYIEYSNENWNFNSLQSDAAAIAAANAGSPINFDGIYPNTDSAGWTIAQRYLAERTLEISNDFRTVYGNSAMPGTSADPTVRPLFEWQYGGNWGAVGLDFLNTYYNNADGVNHVATPEPVNYYLWGGGGAWYTNTNHDTAPNLTSLFASGLATPDSVISDVQLATQFGLKDVGYEGGFKVGDDNATQFQIQAGMDPRAQALTVASVNAFFADGGNLPIVYSASGAAHYNYSVEADPTGATDIFDQNTPKMKGYLQAEQSLPPAATIGTPLPTATNDALTINEGNIFSQSNGAAVASYLFSAASPGTYTVTIQGTADSQLTTEHFLLNGKNIGSVALPIWSAVPDIGTSSTITFTVPSPGLYNLAVYDDGPTRIHYTGKLVITRHGPLLTTPPATTTTATSSDSAAALTNLALGGIASASNQNGAAEGASQAFDGLNSTKWLAFSNSAWLQYQFTNNTPGTVNQYTLTSANDDYGRDPSSWQVLASNDGVNWTLIDSQSHQTFSARNTTNTYTVASPGNYSFYRINITSNTGGDDIQLAGWGLYSNPLALPPQNLLVPLTGGTPFASSENFPNEGAAKAFDNNDSTKWLAFSTTPYLAYRTDNANVVVQYTLTSANDDYGRDPASWRIIGSNDGVNWTLLDVQTNQTFASRFQTNTYTMTNTTAYKYYGLKITANAGGAQTQLANWSLYTNASASTPAIAATPALIVGGIASASNENGPYEAAAQALDFNATTKWLAFSNSAWLQIAAPTSKAYIVTQYSLTSANDDYGRDPKDFQLLASNDGLTWTTLDSQSAQTFSDRLTTNTYTINNTTAYRYYRLNITANNGGGEIQLADFNLFGSTLTV